jgi:hypothetical protein
MASTIKMIIEAHKLKSIGRINYEIKLIEEKRKIVSARFSKDDSDLLVTTKQTTNTVPRQTHMFMIAVFHTPRYCSKNM